MQQLKLEYQSCVETEQSAIQSFANDRIKCLLAKLTSMSPKEKKASERLLMQATLQQCDEILKPSTVDKSIVFRSLEAQVLLRFQFWAKLGDKFVQYYKKQKLSRKKNRRKHHGRKEQTSSNQFVLNDICDLLSMLAMKLPQSLPFAAFLNSTLDRRRYYSDGTSNLPKDLFQKIYRRFEIPDPETTTETEEFVDFAAIKSPTNARMKRRDSMASIGSASSSKENMNVPDSKPLATKGSGASLQQQPRLKKKAAALNLVAPTKRRNSLFGGRRSLLTLWVVTSTLA
ncbi:expressed unknown protein [Seminavis robusta]|uniref:Uncharacterized protein n=1 Tax=Seminavis robusta TaxID=568900 RepID=A0A9N8EFZ0_9STRA|nr:expressed unknown protein [Seminavis robusta]|eukprot:Sro1100_g241290.1 n/a (286) ;mRNA; f:23740-24597